MSYIVNNYFLFISIQIISGQQFSTFTAFWIMQKSLRTKSKQR